MNILLVTPFRLTASGGVSTAVRALSREFAETHSVTILLQGESNRLIEKSDGTLPVFSSYLRGPHITNSCLRALISFTLFLPVTLLQLYMFLRRRNIDIVLIQYPLPWVVYFAILRWVSSWKLVVTYQGNDAHDVPLWSWLEQRCISFLIASSDRIVAVSKSLLQELSLVLPGVRKTKSIVIPNGAPLDLISQSNLWDVKVQLPRQYILTVGHLIVRKGVDLLLKALRIVSDRGEAMNLVVVGEGPERQNLLRLVAELKLSKNVIFVGDQPQDVVFGLLKNCLFFVLASRAEGLPLVIVEAMACGKAVVATNVDGVPEIVSEGRTGLLVVPNDEIALGGALVKMYRDQPLRDRLGSRGKERACESFSWERIASQYVSLFEMLRSR